MIAHKDKNNVDTSIIFGLGDYTGGELNVEGEKFDIHYKIIEFDNNTKELILKNDNIFIKFIIKIQLLLI